MKIKKLITRLAISAVLRLETVKWTAYAILVALGVVRPVELIERDVTFSVIHWLKWIPSSKRKGESDIMRIIVRKSNLGMKLMVRGP